MSTSRGLRVRQHERWDIKLPAEFAVTGDHRAQVRFSPNASAIDEGAFQGETIDISPGGLAFVSRLFIPRRCEGVIKVFLPASLDSKGDDKQVPQLLFERQTIVRRIKTLDHKPSYKIGLSFAELDIEIEKKIVEIQASLVHSFPVSTTSQGEGDA